MGDGHKQIRTLTGYQGYKYSEKNGLLMWRMGLGSIVGNGHKQLWRLKGYQIIKVRKNGEAIGC